MSATNDGIFRYGQFERAVDPTDYAYQERIEAAIERMRQRVDTAQQITGMAAKLRGIVQAVAGVFDDVFGDGASGQVLGSSTSLDACMEALKALADFNRVSSDAAVQRWNERYAQFGPNRARHRAEK